MILLLNKGNVLDDNPLHKMHHGLMYFSLAKNALLFHNVKIFNLLIDDKNVNLNYDMIGG